MREYIAGSNDAGVRLSRFVQSVTRGLPSGTLHKAFRNKRIKINGRRAAPDTRLNEGDIVQLYINDEFFPQERDGNPPAVSAQLPAFDVVWQDAGLAVLYKPAGVLCHSDISGRPTLLDAFTARLIQDGEYNPAAENTFAPALCNRLDQGTEGLLLAAKTYPALRDANAIIRQNLLQKTYLAITTAPPPEGEFSAWLSRDTSNKTTHISAQASPGAKAIHTRITVLERKGSLALCEIGLLTGRTHQIRAHLAFLGAPLLGDAKYGAQPPNSHALRSQALCAYKLAFSPELPPDNTQSHLAGRQFIAQQAALPALWQSL